MTVAARLLAARLQGFKSFAGRTVVEFGPGISAVIGPNGAGKSNLADALRWALGEQGRALRTRRSEDVIFAGSEGKPALGMAEVTVVVENADGLLPVDYSVVELGRRLFRSGENEYLLNGTRVRLRDLEDLLDSARLADNAFLFIGQGMVDQALALRPEERRPLFEEVAGVRRHERRKRAAQEQLVDAEGNLARVRDILAELRPQARRLAAQAEQQAARDTAATALAEALVAAGRQRWFEAAGRFAAAETSRAESQAEVDAAIAALRAADDEAFTLTDGLERQLATARTARADLEAARAALQSALVADARRIAERESLARERMRLDGEAGGLAERIESARRQLSGPPPAPPEEAEDGANETPTAASPFGRSAGERGAAAPGHARDAARHARETLAARQRALDEEAATYERAQVAEREAEAAHHRAIAEREDAVAAASAAAEALEAGRREVAALEGRRRAAEDQLRTARNEAARLAERLAVLDERLRDPEGGRLPPGAEPLAPGLHVESRLRTAVEAALGAAARASVVDRGSLDAATPPASPVVLRDHLGASLGANEGAAVLGAALDAGGGRLADAVSADPTGAARRILQRAVWVPDLPAALSLATSLAPGWIVVTLAGDSVSATGLVVPAPRSSILGTLDERARLAAESEVGAKAVAQAEATLAAIETSLREATTSAATDDGTAAGRQAERAARIEAETAAARRHELLGRETAWSRAQVERLRAEVARLVAIAAETPDGTPPPETTPGRSAPGTEADMDAARRAQRAAAWTAHRAAMDERRRAEGALAAAVERAAAVARETEDVAARHAAVEAETPGHAATLAELEARVAHAEASLRGLDVDEGTSRDRLHAVEIAGRAARERLRVAESRARAAEVAELEARMALDGVREQLLVDLAGLGGAGLRALGVGERPGFAGDEDASAALEAALDALTPAWSTDPPATEAPAASRIGTLRRRYHELGATNPYAADEHAEVRERLTALEAQRDDLDRAIGATRRLIADLERLITEQFESTFHALEAAFDRRFAQLFGGGHARLALTSPDDPTASGVEIIARPPGKKAQPLSMLSGGERALTAVGLLFAMLEVRPVPFCVLDEVDAALDEANIGRFADALRELAAEIQFVVITHNRGTIEEADALYGITIGEDAVSRVVSLRLEGERPAKHTGAVRVAS